MDFTTFEITTLTYGGDYENHLMHLTCGAMVWCPEEATVNLAMAWQAASEHAKTCKAIAR